MVTWRKLKYAQNVKKEYYSKEVHEYIFVLNALKEYILVVRMDIKIIKIIFGIGFLLALFLMGWRYVIGVAVGMIVTAYYLLNKDEFVLLSKIKGLK